MKHLSFCLALLTASNLLGITPHVYVTNNLGTAMEVLDVTEDTTQFIYGFAAPRVVKVTTDGINAYVVEDGGAIQVIETSTHTVTTMAATVPNPTALAITPNNQFLYITSANNTVTVISTQNNTIVKKITGFNNPEDVKISPNGLFAYVTNQGAGTVSVIDTTSNLIINTILVGGNPTGFTVTNNGLHGYVTDPLNDCLYQIDLVAYTFVGTVYGFNTPRYIVMSIDDNFGYVTCTGDQTVIKFRLSDNQILTSLKVPSPLSLAVTADGQYLYVGSSIGTVFKFSTISTTALELVSALPGFGNPSNITVTLDNPPPSTVNGCLLQMSPGVYQTHVIWQPAPGTPTQYRIYRDASLKHYIATVPPTTTQYYQSAIAGQTYWYYLVADYANGFSATMGSVMITPTRQCTNAME